MYKVKLVSKYKGGYNVEDIRQGIVYPMSNGWVKEAIEKGYVSNGIINNKTNQINMIKEKSQAKKDNLVNLYKTKAIVEERIFKTPNDSDFVQVWNVRLVRKGGKYSEGALVHKRDNPLVEFVNHETGRVVADYYIDTILEGQGGLNLGRGQRNMIYPVHMNEIREWLKLVQ